ncbi:MAG: dihydroneopterin aldolase [Cyclobacteriaceae bacterium]|nr:dihydroneopterin aldolase [Cyclobacteriaceae bacterium]UYN86357.1 MAG: dihydroneopterin aldolase [Cyclobacteriaceae bacterium]
MTGRVALEGLEFHAFHGVYPHERESGNWFEVDVAVETDFTADAFQDDLSGTVNYEALFRIIKDEMEKPSKLLETVAGQIIDCIFRELPVVQAVELKISKINPPIGGKCKRATVEIYKKR